MSLITNASAYSQKEYLLHTLPSFVVHLHHRNTVCPVDTSLHPVQYKHMAFILYGVQAYAPNTKSPRL